MKITKIQIAMSLLLMLVFVTSSTKTKAKSDLIWQVSQTPNIKLGVREKNGELGGYRATFVVINSKGKRYSASYKVKEDGWGEAIFPDDFQFWPENGIYKWKCYVGDKVVVGDSFQVTTGGIKALNKPVFK